MKIKFNKLGYKFSTLPNSHLFLKKLREYALDHFNNIQKTITIKNDIERFIVDTFLDIDTISDSFDYDIYRAENSYYERFENYFWTNIVGTIMDNVALIREEFRRNLKEKIRIPRRRNKYGRFIKRH